MKIKRPLFITALSVLVVIYGINTMPESVLYCSLALFVLFTVIHKSTADRYTHHLILFLLAAVIAAGCFGVYSNNLKDELLSLTQYETVVAQGTVTDKVNTSYSYSYTVDLSEVNDINVSNFAVSLYSEDYLEPGDEVKLHGKLNSFTPKNNYLYNYSQGIFASFSAEKVEITGKDTGVISFFNNINVKLTDISRKLFSYDTAAVAVSMGYGDKSLLDNATKESFKFTGISHALVVSGLHIGFITGFISWLFKFIPLHKKVKNIVLSVFVLLFMGIIGFTPGIVRAGSLIIALLLGRNYTVETDSYTVLAAIILITLSVNPYSANNGSLLLSYAAYFGVIQAVEYSQEKKLGTLISSLLVSVMAVLYTMPFLARMGMKITLLSPMFNLLLAYIIKYICILSFFLPLISLVPVVGQSAAAAIAPLNDLLIRILMSVSNFSENNLSFAMVDLSSEKIRFTIMAVVLVTIAGYIQFTDKKKRTTFILMVSIAVIMCYNYINNAMVTVKVFDGSSNPSYVIITDTQTHLVASENINHSTFKNILTDLNTDSFDSITVCSLKEADTDMYSEYTDKLKIISDTQTYSAGVFTVETEVRNRKMSAVININDTTIGFSHNKADMSGENLDFYFFGGSVPAGAEADNYFYFYPVIKKNSDMVREKQAKELYDILTIKITDDRYYIKKDVKNFGNRL